MPQSTLQDFNGRSAVHDLRNLFAIVSSAAALVKDGPPRAQQDALLTAIADAARRGAAATSELLSSTADSNAGMTDICKRLLAMKPLLGAAAGHAELKLELVNGPVFVRSDPVRLEQVILELVTNAAEAIQRRGRITIRVRSTRGRAWIEVADQGLPHAKAIERSPLRFRGGTGRGLGLKIVRAFVERAHGRCRLFKIPDRGTVFAMSLPTVLSIAAGDRRPHYRAAPVAKEQSDEERQSVAA